METIREKITTERLRASDLANPEHLAEAERVLQEWFPEIDFSVDPAAEILANPETDKVINRLLQIES